MPEVFIKNKEHIDRAIDEITKELAQYTDLKEVIRTFADDSRARTQVMYWIDNHIRSLNLEIKYHKDLLR